MTSRGLVKGANVAVHDVLGETTPTLLVVIESVTAESATVVPDASLLVVGSDRRVRSNDGLIFYNQPVGLDGALQLIDPEDVDSPDGIRRDVIRVDLSRIPDWVTQIVIAASADATSEPFGMAQSLRMSVAAAVEPDCPVLHYDVAELTTERALVFGEIYRRGDQWKIRAVGQGYAEGLAALVTDFGVVVDDEPADPQSDGTDDLSPPESVDDAQTPRTDEAEAVLRESGAEGGQQKVAISRHRRPSRLPRDWADRKSPYCPPVLNGEPWSRARLFPSVGMKPGAEQEGRTTSVLLSVMAIVPEFGRVIASQLGAPGGRVETFTEVRFTNAGVDVRPDGLIRVTRAGREWVALVEVKTGKAPISPDQVEAYLKLAKAKGFDAVVTISRDLSPSSDELPYAVDGRLRRAVSLRHLSWEEVIAEASILLQCKIIEDRLRRRLVEELLWYASDVQSGMWIFDDMGRQWVTVRESVKNRTIGPGDASSEAICLRFDQLSRHLALQLSALTGQRVAAQSPPNRSDTVSRLKQLADSGELFATLRVTGAAGVVVLNANLARERIGCSIKTSAPRTGRTVTKVNWLIRQLADADDSVRVTAHHAGSRTHATSALLGAVREDASVILPRDGKDIRDFSVSMESSMGSKRAGSEGGFVAAMAKLTNTFYMDVVESLRSGRDT